MDICNRMRLVVTSPTHPSGGRRPEQENHVGWQARYTGFATIRWGCPFLIGQLAWPL